MNISTASQLLCNMGGIWRPSFKRPSERQQVSPRRLEIDASVTETMQAAATPVSLKSEAMQQLGKCWRRCNHFETRRIMKFAKLPKKVQNLEELVADTTRRLKQAESGARRDREALVQAQHQNHLIAAERDMVVKAIRDVQENLVKQLERRVDELNHMLLSQTAALEECNADCDGLRSELARKNEQIVEHETAMQKATALQRRIMNSRWFHLFGTLEKDAE
eukprot:INCI14135.1.p1 GENE.INCI14135.1~~INCI14135.1.p1  ORF type:complete len:221 (+),score=36.99 INCI14135.1:203-865(+)